MTPSAPALDDARRSTLMNGLVPMPVHLRRTMMRR
jgi:hypothetical protein